jgi:hypothetical protein
MRRSGGRTHTRALAVDHADYRFSDDVDLGTVIERLAGHGDLTVDSSVGVRFEPDHEGWPVTYLRSDGHIHVMPERLTLTDVVDYVGELSALVGVGIVEESRRH